MNRIFVNKNSFAILFIALSFVTLFTACEQQVYEPNLSAASGGGTVSTYKAYTLSSATGSTISGRVVFYKYSSSVTLVQMGLYNTTASDTYTASVYQGKLTDGSATVLKPLDSVSGTSGAFSTNKYFTITDASFFDNLATYDANVKVLSGTTVVASGNIGANATPVAQQ